LTDDVMLFGSYATGHKGQTYDLTTGFNQARANVGPINPEESKSFEAGIKSQLLDHRVMLNGTIFHVKPTTTIRPRASTRSAGRRTSA
jgi:iron complex outermembrane receptor protein